MSRFAVYKSAIEGMCGGGDYSLEQACNEIVNSKGWKDVGELRHAIRKWGCNARPGSAFQTAFSVIVCKDVPMSGVLCECSDCLSEDLETEEFNCGEDGEVTQVCTCNLCGRRWEDVFEHSERRELASR